MGIPLAMVAGIACAGLGAADGGELAPWPYAYTGQVLPPPQQIRVHNRMWEIVKGGGQLRARILVGEAATEPEVLAARELAARIGSLAGGIEVPVVNDVRLALQAPIIISLGTLTSNRFNARHLRNCPVQPVQAPEGYWIACYSHKRGFGGVLASGADAVGVYWASKTIQQLLEARDGRVLLHLADVRDWPAFNLRSFKAGGRDWEALRGAGIWAPNAKFNCFNVCYTTVGADQWPNPTPEYRQFVQQMVRYMRARGLDCMPFVNPYYLWKEHIEVSDPADLEALAKTCSIGPAAGGTRVMLCLDDFASKPVREGDRLYRVRSQRDVEKFGDDLAAVNAAMINYLWQKLHTAYPQVRLYVVPPYYWNPTGHYKPGGERYLRKLGQTIPAEVRIVWTGPRVRSTTISPTDVEYYQGLVGRKVMLWDNTLYARHNPPHYLFDAFTTEYPERFWELTSGEVHYNAGASEVYRVGLLCAASYLWNPDAYEAEAVLEAALEAVGGPGASEALLAFRDAFYELWDGYVRSWGFGEAVVKAAQASKHRWLTKKEMAKVRELVGQLQGALERVRKTCRNQRLVEEVEQEAERFTPYLRALDIVDKLPPPPNAKPDNLVPNGDCESVEGGKPVGWGRYIGAGAAELAAQGDAHGGQWCAALTVTRPYDWGDGRKSVNVALMAADSNGYEAGDAPELEPEHVYYVSLWLRGDPLPVYISFTGWKGAGGSGDRVVVDVGIEPFVAPREWTRYTGRFIVPAGVRRGCLKIGIEGWWQGEEPPLGTICVDDVYVGGSEEQVR